jgi:hypothetical protein
MKAILLRVPDPLKHRLDDLRSEGYTLQGYIINLLWRELGHEAAPTPRPRRKVKP